MIHHRRLALDPARIGIPDRLPFRVGNHLEVRDRALLDVEVRDVERVAGFLELRPRQELEADLLLAGRDAEAVELTLRHQLALNAFKAGLPVILAGHQEQAPAQCRVQQGHENPTVGQAGVGPRVIALVRERDLFAGLAADLPLHHDEPARRRILPVPDRRVLAVAGPRRIEIRMRAVAQRVKSGAVHVDDEDRGLPFEHIGIVLESAEADEHVAGLGPGRLEVPVARRHGFSLGLADLVDMDLAVAVVRDPGGAGRAGLAGAGEPRRERRPHPSGGRHRYGCLRGPGQELTSAQSIVV